MKNMKNTKALLIVTTLAASAIAPHAQSAAPGPLVTTAWLAAHLKDPSVVVISSDEATVFAAGHIPGARVLPHMRTLGPAHRPDHLILPPEALAKVLAEAGAVDGARVVLYGESPMATGWLYMAFASVGHAADVSLLDGNLSLWGIEGNEVARGPAAAAAVRGRLTPRPAADFVVDAAWVRARLEKPGVRVLDVRTAREWDAGRLPGATLVLWQDLFASPNSRRFKSPDEIRALFAKAGVTSGDQVVTYCAIGMRASLMYFAATRIAGLPGRIYVGSFEDWQRQPGFPIVR